MTIEIESKCIGKAKRFTSSNFEKYGVAMSVEGLKGKCKTQSANQGSAFKLIRVGEMINKYPNGDGKTFWDIFQSGYVKEKWINSEYNCKVLERHLYTSQTFIPMGISKDVKDAYVVICAPDLNGVPDWENSEMFIASGDQSVMYNPGVWHAPMVVLVDSIDFMVICSQNENPHDVCEEIEYSPGFKLKL